jgi:RNA polymerase sigma factor (sigma-70 family)
MISIRDYIRDFVPDESRGRFRTWIRRIIRSRIADQYRRKQRNPLEKVPRRQSAEDSATSTTNRIPDLNKVELDRVIDGKLEQAILVEARRSVSEKVRAEDFQSFDFFELREIPAAEVGRLLGVSATTVRVRAFRVRQALKREARRIARRLERPKCLKDVPLDRESSGPFVDANWQVTSEPGYEFIEEIGRGGYGYVYLCRRSAHAGADDGFVAAKFIYRHVFGPFDNPASGAAYQRALDGLQNFRSLSKESPYLLRISDVRQRHEEGYFCYVMELADDLGRGRRIRPGDYTPKTLKNLIERHGHRERLPIAKCVDIAIGLARGLQLLHDAGYTHRDVRPSNIIFVADVPKLADIDLLAGHDAALASYIPRDYAAPEGSHSRQADIFSLGKTIYEMITCLPVKDYPRLPTDIGTWADHGAMVRMNRIIARACARDPRRRYATAEELLKEFVRLQ